MALMRRSCEEFPQRQGRITNGRSINVTSNFFKLSISNHPLWFYDVTIDPITDRVDPSDIRPDRKQQKSNKSTNRAAINQLCRDLSISKEEFGIAYDGEKILLSAREIRQFHIGGDFSQLVNAQLRSDGRNERQRERRCVVTIKPTQSSGLSSLFNSSEKSTGINFLNIILRQGACEKLLPIGSGIFYPRDMPDRQRANLGNYLEIGYGYKQSARSCEKGMMLNVDKAVCVFYKPGPLMDLVKSLVHVDEIQRGIAYGSSYYRKLRSELMQLIVSVDYSQFQKNRGAITTRRFRVVDISRRSVAETKFLYRDENGREQTLSVANYYQMVYGYKVQFPNIPCICFGGKPQGSSSGSEVESDDESSYKFLPMEICDVVKDMRYRNKLRDRVLSDLTRTCTEQVNEKKKSIVESLKEIRTSNLQIMGEYGIEIESPVMWKSQGRLLPLPPVLVGGDRTIQPKELVASWDPMKYIQTSEIKRWTFCHIGHRNYDEVIHRFIKKLSDDSRKYDMQISSSPTISKLQLRDVLRNVKSLFSGNRSLLPDPANKPELIIFVLPRANDLYEQIKLLCDNTYGIRTQALCEDNFDPRSTKQGARCLSPAFIFNVLLKINVKTGGLNHCAAANIFKEPTMVCGVDVTHPSPVGQAKAFNASIAACVATHNIKLCKYTNKILVQAKKGTEMVKIGPIVLDCADEFKKINKRYPKNIVVFRDGISEGEFEEAKKTEIQSIMDSISKIPERPKLTFVVVTKRHKTRIFPAQQNLVVPRSFNIPAGTVLDTDVVSDEMFDFYMASHAGLMGTTRPAKYTILHDENNYDANFLATLSLALSFNFQRCTKSISLPAPVAMAHYLAYRARQHLQAAEYLKLKPNEGESHTQFLARILKPHFDIARNQYFM